MSMSMVIFLGTKFKFNYLQYSFNFVVSFILGLMDICQFIQEAYLTVLSGYWNLGLYLVLSPKMWTLEPFKPYKDVKTMDL